jgi:hypothetical protein
MQRNSKLELISGRELLDGAQQNLCRHLRRTKRGGLFLSSETIAYFQGRQRARQRSANSVQHSGAEIIFNLSVPVRVFSRGMPGAQPPPVHAEAARQSHDVRQQMDVQRKLGDSRCDSLRWVTGCDAVNIRVETGGLALIGADNVECVVSQ